MEDCDHSDECKMGMGFLKEGYDSKLEDFSSFRNLECSSGLCGILQTRLIQVCVLQLMAIGETSGLISSKGWACFVSADISLAVESSSSFTNQIGKLSYNALEFYRLSLKPRI